MGSTAVGDFCRREISLTLLPLPDIDPRFLVRPARSLVTILTELSHLPNFAFGRT